MKARLSNRSASALIVILPIIAILTLIILTVLSMAVFDSHLAANTFEQTRASVVAKYALDDVCEGLNKIPLDRHWAAGPGHIEYWDGNSGWSNIDLFSGTNSAAPIPSDYLDGADALSAAKCVQLNVPLADGSYSIMSTNAEYGTTAPNMTVKWIYVLADGTTRTDPSTLPNQGVIGRYGYWTDVENGRVNINTAGFGMVNGPTDAERMRWTVENWVAVFGTPNLVTPAVASSANYDWSGTMGGPGAGVTPSDYCANVLQPNPWLTDGMVASGSAPITFTNSSYASPPLTRGVAQTNSIQNLTAHPSSIDLSCLDFPAAITPEQRVQQSFDTFRYAGSYFLRSDALNSISYLSDFSQHPTIQYAAVTQSPSGIDTSVRFFHDPSDWQLIVDAATYKLNKGYLTVKGRSPEINPWGLPKSVLSACAHDGIALSDLTEKYTRSTTMYGTASINDAGLNTQDSRSTQWPSVYPMFTSGYGWNTALLNTPYPLINNDRANFRDLSCEELDSGTCSEAPRMAALINDLKNLLYTPIPGFGNNRASTLGGKYDFYGSTGGEAEQVAVELTTFVDSCLDNYTPGYAFYSGASGVPMASIPNDSTLSGNPASNGSTRRMGLNTPYLVNEITMSAQVVPFSVIQGFEGIEYDYTTHQWVQRGGVLSISYTTPGAYQAPDTGYGPNLYFLIADPGHPPPNSPDDKYVKIALDAETVIPPHYGFSQPMMGKNVYNPGFNCIGDMQDTVLEYSLDRGVTWIGPLNFTGIEQGQFLVAPYNVPGGPDYRNIWATMIRGGSNQNQNGFVIGPFTKNDFSGLALKISTRFAFHSVNGFTSDMFPGIYLDKPNVSSPNDYANYASTFLQFNFTPDNPAGDKTIPIIDDYEQATVSLEATDPRVNRTNTLSNWSTSKAQDILYPSLPGHTLGAENTTITGDPAAASLPAPPDASKIAKPPASLQLARTLLRRPGLTPPNPTTPQQPEYQTASRILGLPGVGYLSEVPTGVDSGRQWSTMNFHANSDSPPDWLLWNLFYVPFDRSMSNQTDGKMNVNARLYPFQAPDGTPLLRTKPLEALIGNRVSSSGLRATLAHDIAAGPPIISGAVLPRDLYVYAGQICQVPGVADSSTGVTEYDEEHITRDVADIVTTQCSDYRVFVVAQALRQSPTGQITPISTQRVETTLSRDIDAGQNGGYPVGNYDDVCPPAMVYLRSDYRPISGAPPVPTATRTEVQQQSNHPHGYGPWGLDHSPNGPSNWIVPQKIEVTSYKIIK